MRLIELSDRIVWTIYLDSPPDPKMVCSSQLSKLFCVHPISPSKDPDGVGLRVIVSMFDRLHGRMLAYSAPVQIRRLPRAVQFASCQLAV
jgi:hypothetical protein